MELKADVIADDTEVLRAGTAADEGVEGGEDLLELPIEPVPLAHLDRGDDEAEEGEEGEEGGGHGHARVSVCVRIELELCVTKFTLELSLANKT